MICCFQTLLSPATCGTTSRAVQKLVETLRTPEQVALATEALKPGVVTLIKDLNGTALLRNTSSTYSPPDPPGPPGFPGYITHLFGHLYHIYTNLMTVMHTK